MKKYTIILIVLLVSIRLQAATCTCVCNGNWNSPSTWSGGYVPSCNDTIMICGSHICTISTQQDYSACVNPIYIYVDGVLMFDTGNKLTLPTGSVVTINIGGSLNPGHGGGSSNLITIGTTDVWSAGSGKLDGFAILTDNAPLPIELLNFEASVKNGIVEINWTTASETNNDYFTVQRAQDGLNFENVNIKAGSGTTTAVRSYKSIDNVPYKGISYYRLKQTDFDGNSTVSNAVGVNTGQDTGFSFELFMNPNDGSKLRIELTSEREKEAQLVIIDANGNNIYSKNIVTVQTGKNVNDFYLPKQLAPGIYMIGLTSDERTFCKKFIVQ